MTHKTYYQAATSEVADGVLDDALWTKVNVELIGQDAIVRQARYIQLRAQEMALKTKAQWVKRFVPKKWWHWVVAAVIGWFAAVFLLDIFMNGF